MRQVGLIAKIIDFGFTVYVAAGFGIFLSVADNYMRKSGMLPVPPTVGAVLFLTSIVGFALIKDTIYKRPTAALGILLRSNNPVIFPFFLLAFLSLALALHPTAYWGDGKKWIYLQTYDFFIFLTASLLPSIALIRNRFRFFVIVGLLTILGSIWYEVEYPGTYSSVPTRASGFPGNSNFGALVTVMICSMSLGYRDGSSRLLDMIVLAITGLGLYFTFSRSGMINFVMLICIYVGFAMLSGKDRLKTGLTVGGSIAGLVTFFLLVVPLISESSNLTSGSSKTQNRLLALFEGELVDDGSAADRIEAARETLDRIEASPVIGHGTGFNRKMRQTPHNLYLKLWVDSGIFGVLTWLSLLGCGFWMFSSRKYRPGQALVVVTLLGGFFSHNILEQRTFLFLFGTAASMSLYEAAARLASQRKHTGGIPSGTLTNLGITRPEERQMPENYPEQVCRAAGRL